ncbi:MarR family winged helix-turn-helix transcriptional regulator [Novosphingobium taihuense]|uniref:DNA-binding MarR family transcriptional regulator n=1 Tax=Novosphingobium taihuense TaxID=260085 RepID=A0A7W7EU96_9SPHN|nr:MarR family winged helix-turn-helix transcriptional regulator [Novosphingobium taihuense]MBB4612110.1 DNA-binding MarR family transcriptional regulator [Novosphingobium taihuense]TWH88536.1 DNA-binding MarR family transcriptional regulator [Novosphingobium taihuense]
MDNTPPAEPPADTAAQIEGEVALLVDLLKLGTFIGAPMREGVADPLGLTTTDLRIVLALGGEGELAGHDLSEIMGVPPMNVSRAIAALMQRGLVEPGANRVNRRRKPVRLTEAGQRLFARTIPAMAHVGADLFKGVPARDREAFRRVAASVLTRIGRWGG